MQAPALEESGFFVSLRYLAVMLPELNAMLSEKMMRRRICFEKEKVLQNYVILPVNRCACSDAACRCVCGGFRRRRECVSESDGTAGDRGGYAGKSVCTDRRGTAGGPEHSGLWFLKRLVSRFFRRLHAAAVGADRKQAAGHIRCVGKSVWQQDSFLRRKGDSTESDCKGRRSFRHR